MTEQEHPWETVPEQDAVPETSPAENTDTPDTPIAVSNPDAVLPPDEPTEPDGLKPSDLEPAAISAEPVPESVPRKQLGKLFWESFCMVFPPVLLVVALGLVAYYIICPAKGEFHADCTDTIYWAKATFDSGKLISPDFSYACLLPFGAWAEDELRGYEPGKGYIYVTLGRYCQTVDGGTIGQDSFPLE